MLVRHGEGGRSGPRVPLLSVRVESLERAGIGISHVEIVVAATQALAPGGGSWRVRMSYGTARRRGRPSCRSPDRARRSPYGPTDAVPGSRSDREGRDGV